MAGCAAITTAGKQCSGTPIDDSAYCYVHHPDYVEERRRNGSKGGRRGGRGRPLRDVNQIKERLSTLADDVLTGAVDKSVGNVISNILSTYLRAVSLELTAREQDELEERLTEIESALSSGPRHPGGDWYRPPS
jgi:hypothetical protein